ncbi:plasmid recombination protein, partial [Klebsiella pneumoniae]
MSYQFIHVEDYSKVIAKKRGNGGKGKYNEETKGRSVRDIIAEAKREEGNCPHVENPKPPILLYGKNLDEVEKLAYEYHENTKLTDKNGKEKKLRSDANILLAGVVSLNRENEDIWDEYKNDAIAFLSNKYGKKLVSVIEHTDEANPHFHFYVIQEPGKRFDLIHDGKKALFENRDKKKHDQNIAYLNAMRKVQEDFFRVVSSNYGLSKDGPKRKRTSRKDYFKQKREIKLIQQVKEQAKIDGYNFAVDDFHGKS